MQCSISIINNLCKKSICTLSSVIGKKVLFWYLKSKWINTFYWFKLLKMDRTVLKVNLNQKIPDTPDFQENFGFWLAKFEDFNFFGFISKSSSGAVILSQQHLNVLGKFLAWKWHRRGESKGEGERERINLSSQVIFKVDTIGTLDLGLFDFFRLNIVLDVELLIYWETLILVDSYVCPKTMVMW